MKLPESNQIPTKNFTGEIEKVELWDDVIGYVSENDCFNNGRTHVIVKIGSSNESVLKNLIYSINGATLQ